MAQSVELLLDDRAEAVVRHQWDLLADAGLPSGRRSSATEHHRPHLTLYAGDSVSETAEAAVSVLVAGLDLEVQVGALMVFGPRRGQVILVRQVTPTMELLQLQAQVALACQAAVDGQFGLGRWSPHVTLARRIPVDSLGAALASLDRTADRPVPARITMCRRWDGNRKTAWLL